MIYRKNLPWAERALRLAAGAALIAYASQYVSAPLWSAAFACAGLTLAATAFIGFCPLCAMVGRKPLTPPTER